MLKPITKLVAFSLMSGIALATPVVSHASMGEQILREGMRNPDVAELQNALKAEGNFDYKSATGYYGSITTQAVKDFQKENGLQIDGIAGPQTFRSLKGSDAGSSGEASPELTVDSTAYTADCEGCSGVTATGINLHENPGLKVASVDPSVIPLGSKLYVEGYGTAIAGDKGGGIKGKEIDLFFPNRDQALDWGHKTVRVKILR
ncbi:peptidoglycan-binding protein [Aneurinibacillus tyrosinisolvens]|uniref:peptidoglycan-binding protein n=1 Tax=Aneurinibacillus tyrosinisolvens TaxID=1443435 RepID=UPI00063F10CC|nr:peptidoglycan-binding protein [Aneurinibacillus tyrosinisolvens]